MGVGLTHPERRVLASMVLTHGYERLRADYGAIADDYDGAPPWSKAVDATLTAWHEHMLYLSSKARA